jgi:hypothetical protein
MQHTSFPRIQPPWTRQLGWGRVRAQSIPVPQTRIDMHEWATRYAAQWLGCEMTEETYTADPAVLSCWKDIANYLGKGVRTVQRWEREFQLPVRRPKGANCKSAVVVDPRDLDAWLASRWALRASKKTAESLESSAELMELKAAIKKKIDAARALRAQQGQLIHDLSAATQMLVQNCDLLSKGGTLDSAQAKEGSRITRVDYAGLGSLPALVETQRRSSEEHRSIMHFAKGAS